MLGYAPGVRSAGRLVAYVVVLGASLAYPAMEQRTDALRAEVASMRAQAAALDRSRAELDALRARVERVQQLSGKVEALLASAKPDLMDASTFSRRQVSVKQQSFSRAQAEAWLRGFDAGAAGFLVVDAFSIKVTNAAEGLFDESADPERLGQLLVSLEGDYIGRAGR